MTGDFTEEQAAEIRAAADAIVRLSRNTRMWSHEDCVGFAAATIRHAWRRGGYFTRLEELDSEADA